MSQSKKTARSKSKSINDVAHPGTTTPSDTSKPIINQRPIMKDPMVVEDDKPEDSVKKPLPKKTAETKVLPLEEPVQDEAKPDIEEPAQETAEPDSEAKPEADIDATNDQSNPEAKTAKEVAKETKLQQLIEDKKYFLPINAVEQRRSKRFVTLGIFLAILLALAWTNIALDAGLIHLDNVKPLTHFFSN